MTLQYKLHVAKYDIVYKAHHNISCSIIPTEARKSNLSDAFFHSVIKNHGSRLPFTTALLMHYVKVTVKLTIKSCIVLSQQCQGALRTMILFGKWNTIIIICRMSIVIWTSRPQWSAENDFFHGKLTRCFTVHTQPLSDILHPLTAWPPPTTATVHFTFSNCAFQAIVTLYMPIIPNFLLLLQIEFDVHHSNQVAYK